MITLNFTKQLKVCITAFIFLLTLNTYSQDPVTTTNDLISGVTVESFFAEQIDASAGKNNAAVHLVDGDEDTDWAGESSGDRGETLILNLNGSYDLAEIQLLSVAKLYLFQIWVSTTGTDSGDFTNAFPTEGDANGHLVSSGDLTYKSFVIANTIANAKYVMIKCYGRSDSAWNTISELKFYKEGTTASTISNELKQTSLFPSPANNQLQIRNNNNVVSKVEIFNLIGKKLISVNLSKNNQTINTSSLSNGIYLVKLSDENNISTSKKIVIQH